MHMKLRKHIDKQRIIEYTTIFVLAVIISVTTAILPMLASVPKVVYANSIPTFLISMSIGPLFGSLYAIAISLVLNNIGMGSGTLLYVLLFQILEAIVIGSIWHKKKFHIARYLITVIGATFILKPFSYVFYYLFNQQIVGSKGFLGYLFEMMGSYISKGWIDAFALYATGILVSYVIIEFVFYCSGKLIKKRQK